MREAPDVLVMPAATAAAIASSYELGVVADDPVYAARGEQGRIWRLNTDSGSWAVKELLLPVGEAEAARDVEFQLAAAAAGIPLPVPRRAQDGRIILPAGETACPWNVRVYQWADLAHEQAVSGAEIGSVTASLHQVRHAEHRPVEAWFSEPVGEPAMQALLSDARRGKAARAAYAAYRAAGGPAQLSEAADFAMAAAVQSHLLQFYGRRALDAAESAENRARARKRGSHAPPAAHHIPDRLASRPLRRVAALSAKYR